MNSLLPGIPRPGTAPGMTWRSFARCARSAIKGFWFFEFLVTKNPFISFTIILLFTSPSPYYLLSQSTYCYIIVQGKLSLQMSGLKRRLEDDEAAIASLASEVQNLKKFKVGDRTITMREVPVPARQRSAGFPFAPPAPAPRVNVNVQAPRNTYADIREGERQAAMSGYKMSFPRVNYNAPISVAPSSGYRSRTPFLRRKGFITASDKAKSAASIARASRAASKGGMRPKKATLLKAGRQADFLMAYRMWMKQKKARLLQALKSRTKDELARCLANQYKRSGSI